MDEFRRHWGLVLASHLGLMLGVATMAFSYTIGVFTRPLMREFGCERTVIGVDECVRIEPALAAARSQLVGGDYTAADESGDAHKFTRELAALAAARGVAFRFGAGIERIELSAAKSVRW